jgi:hypothetical protein
MNPSADKIAPTKRNQRRPIRLSYADAMTIVAALEDLAVGRALTTYEVISLNGLVDQIQTLHRQMMR